MNRDDALGVLAADLKRQLVPYEGGDYPVYALMADEALTGFICIAEAKIGEFKRQKSILMPLSRWCWLRFHSDLTATPFHFAAVGNASIKIASWRPLTGMKYAARVTPDGVMSHINLSEFKKEVSL